MSNLYRTYLFFGSNAMLAVSLLLLHPSISFAHIICAEISDTRQWDGTEKERFIGPECRSCEPYNSGIVHCQKPRDFRPMEIASRKLQ